MKNKFLTHLTITLTIYWNIRQRSIKDLANLVFLEIISYGSHGESAFTYPKFIIETVEQDVKYVQN